MKPVVGSAWINQHELAGERYFTAEAAGRTSERLVGEVDESDTGPMKVSTDRESGSLFHFMCPFGTGRYAT
jgi:hypothetical protein